MPTGNLFANQTPPISGERFDTLLQHHGLRIERIISSADLTPTDYLQTNDEWVLLLHGHAMLRMAGQDLELHSGDYVFIPAQTPHSVLSASEGAIWLALHWQDEPKASPASPI
ncbi:cupin domain-containing protein [Chitinibacter sp. SCUT-21]|uniref:cupin domain-containing protein n=1 Tax=Chitinibacter sp. SCUT-21 TaxID=2970891 RepID=UPI0035A66D1C